MRKIAASIDRVGPDGGRKIKERKPHLLVDSQGLLMVAIVHAADVQGRDGGVLLMASLSGPYPFLLVLHADNRPLLSPGGDPESDPGECRGAGAAACQGGVSSHARVAARGGVRHHGVVPVLDLPSLPATEAFAARVAALARAGDAILLEGPLGAGKTSFARAFLRAASRDAALDVPSPSYTLVQTYDTPRFRAHHFDLWRLDGPAGLVELGWEEARADLVLVEWPDRLGPLRPAEGLTIALAPTAEAARRARISGWPHRIGALL